MKVGGIYPLPTRTIDLCRVLVDFPQVDDDHWTSCQLIRSLGCSQRVVCADDRDRHCIIILGVLSLVTGVGTLDSPPKFTVHDFSHVVLGDAFEEVDAVEQDRVWGLLTECVVVQSLFPPSMRK